ncbi:hypothetical protein Ancab_019479, partial [Ancistrocladus abbreviatus]
CQCQSLHWICVPLVKRKHQRPKNRTEKTVLHTSFEDLLLPIAFNVSDHLQLYQKPHGLKINTHCSPHAFTLEDYLHTSMADTGFAIQ